MTLTAAQLVAGMDALQGYAFNLTRSADGRDELSQAAALRAWEKRDLFDGDADDVRKWLCTIARNLFFDGFRRARLVEVFAVEDLLARSAGLNEDYIAAFAVPPNQESAVAAKELPRAVGAAGAALLREWADTCVVGAKRGHNGRAEIAQRRGVPQGTVSSRVHRLRIVARKAYAVEEVAR